PEHYRGERDEHPALGQQPHEADADRRQARERGERSERADGRRDARLLRDDAGGSQKTERDDRGQDVRRALRGADREEEQYPGAGTCEKRDRRPLGTTLPQSAGERGQRDRQHYRPGPEAPAEHAGVVVDRGAAMEARDGRESKERLVEQRVTEETR